MWQALVAIGTLVLTIPGVVIGTVAFQRSSRTEEAKEKADAVEREVTRRVDAQKVGLEYMERAMAALQQTNLRQQGEIGELRGLLVDCRTEREAMQRQIDELRGGKP